MSSDRTPLTHYLLPHPREVRPAPGVCRVGPGSPRRCRETDPRLTRAVRRWAELLSESTDPRAPVTVAVESGVTPHRDGYRLRVAVDAIDLVGGSPAGCFHGLQTLAQLTDSAAGTVRCCTISDWPDFDTRGLLHDVTRGKVPTLDTLKGLVDRLAALKINQLQLYIEHAFVFSFDPDICSPDEGLTPDEIGELDGYCRERFIQLVPALATLGHMGRVLTMPRYRHLAEVEATRGWHEMSWPERARGLTLNCADPEAHRLVERLWSDVLDAFSSPVVNICGDEPWDLGAGKNRRRFAASGNGRPYMQHIRRTHDVCAARGRRTQAWSDVARNYPSLLPTLPFDLSILHWGYDEKTDYEGTGVFTEQGLDTIVCPGTSGWKRILAAMGLAERNIATLAVAGRRFGAKGLLNTDWGDHGHFQPLACSMHGIATGAALAWRADHPLGAAARADTETGAMSFDASFARVIWRVDDATGIAALRAASTVADTCETWRLMWTTLAAMRDDPTVPTVDAAESMREHATRLLSWMDRIERVEQAERTEQTDPINRGVRGDASEFDELRIAVRFAVLFAEKVRFARGEDSDRAGLDRARAGSTARARDEWGDALSEAADEYARIRKARNKRGGLGDILTALQRVAIDVRFESSF